MWHLCYLSACDAGDAAFAEDAFLRDPEGCSKVYHIRLYHYTPEMREFVLNRVDFAYDRGHVLDVGQCGSEATMRRLASFQLPVGTMDKIAVKAYEKKNVAVMRVLSEENLITAEEAYSILKTNLSSELPEMVRLLSEHITRPHWDCLNGLFRPADKECAQIIIDRHAKFGLAPTDGTLWLFPTVAAFLSPEMFDFYQEKMGAFKDTDCIAEYAIKHANRKLLYHLAKKDVHFGGGTWLRVSASPWIGTFVFANGTQPWQQQCTSWETLRVILDTMASFRSGDSCMKLFRTLPRQLRDIIRQVLFVARRFPPFLLSYMLDWVMVAYSRNIHSHPLKIERASCRGCRMSADDCRTCLFCTFSFCPRCVPDV